MSSPFVAFDTAGDVVAIALGRREGLAAHVVATHDMRARRAALSHLMPAVRDLLAEHDLTPGDLTEVVVGRGPGSFTGVRIGVASAKGLAQGLGVPLYGVGTLDAIAWRLAGQPSGLVGVIADAARGEVYPGLFRVEDGNVTRMTPDRVEKPDRVADEFRALGERLTLTGDGLVRYRELFESVLGDVAAVTEERLWSPDGVGLVAAYQAALREGSVGDGDPATVLPVYTRLSDAEENERAKPPSSGASRPGVGR